MEIKESIESEKDKVKLEPVMPEDLPVRRKRTAEMAGSYDWTPQLVEPGFCAAPVSCFKHVSFLKSFGLFFLYSVLQMFRYQFYLFLFRLLYQRFGIISQWV